MGKKVVKKQESSKSCFVCGTKNDFGLKTEFFEIETGELRARFTAGDFHQSYPGRLHGGIAAAVLDETIGRAVNAASGSGVWGVTADLSIRYRKPVPLNVELVATGRITKDGGRVFEGSGEILLPDGTVAVEASGRYVKFPIDKIADFDPEEEDWRVVAKPDDPAEFPV